MSGRSAYVRKKNTEVKKDKGVARRAPTQLGHYGSYDEPTPAPPAAQRTRSGTSISSGPEVDQFGRRPILPAAETGIEKSALRSFMDSKSNNFRNKLASTITGSAPRTENPSPSRPGSAASPERSYESSLATSPVPVTIPHRSRTTRHDGSFERTHRSTRGVGSSDFGPVVKQWRGGGRLPQPWNRLKKDPELWDPLGDTLVYFAQETNTSSRPPPSFRIPSSVLEETESAFLITILRDGYTYNNDFDFPPSPNSTPSNSRASYTSASRHPPSNPSSSDTTLPLRSPKALQSIHSYSHRGQHTPPSFDSMSSDKGAAPVLHEIYFPAPLGQSKTDSLRHHLTTRNVFALLMNKSLVGINLFQALADLHERLEMYMPDESDNTSMIIDYVVQKCLDDVRNDPASAAGLLAWCEGDNVRWREGWREAFVHCAGMYTRLTTVPEFRDVTPITKALLERAHLELGVRVHSAEARLEEFDFSTMWPVPSNAQTTPPRASFERFRKFLNKFYEHVYFSWPPRSEEERDTWLTRNIVIRLQRDFGALYDYLVDRDVEWDGSEVRSSRKWNIVSKVNRPGFQADSEDLPVTDMLVSFDNQRRCAHIPHPYPMVPESIPPMAQMQKQSSIFSSKKQKPMDDKTMEKRAALAYSEATNIYQLGSEFVSNELVEAFSRFEKTDRPSEVDPYVARKGRWILLYGILQVLSTLSVDTPGLRWYEDVEYFLGPKLRGTPPWRNQMEPSIEEASAASSHCWVVSQTWAAQEGNGGPGFEESLADSSTNASSARFHMRQHRTQAPRHIVIPGLTPDGKARSSSENDSFGEEEEGRLRARQWVNNGGDFRDDNDTVPRWNQKEKIPNWPIPPSTTTNNATFNAAARSISSTSTPASSQGRPHMYTRDVGRSDYQPPAEW